MLISQLFAH